MHRTSNYDLLLRTLSHSPHLADLIRRVHIVWFGHEIYTFGARLLKPQLLKNCEHVYLQVSEWPALPYRYANIAFYPFRTSNLTHFVAELRHDTCSPIIQFLYTLPLLQYLDLECTTSVIHIPERYLQILHKRPCPFNCLTNLKPYRPSMAFPRLMFGPSLKYLLLGVRFGISDSVMQAIRSLRQLQNLDLWSTLSRSAPSAMAPTESQAWRIQNLLSVLHAIQTPERLMQLTIHFDALERERFTYFIDRDSFLNNVLGCNEMKDALRQFPELRRISFLLFENDTCYSKGWWKTEIESRLQTDLHAAISVELDVLKGSDLLWCTEAEIDKIRSRRKKEQESLSSDDTNLSSYEPGYGASSIVGRRRPFIRRK
ncbi:hypothetical protein C8Q74DRAFT_1299076 [Fomes fomentarius]|nr:hypothetical protein C8Q74DRAFT_1299076 [Fomes fomentarius]